MAPTVLLNSVSQQRALSAAESSRAAVAEQAEELRRSRARVVAATDRERRRIERDLHDGAQQSLIAIGIGLSQARELCRTDPDRAARTLDVLRSELRSAHDELRDLAQGVYPPVLTEHGLAAALQSAADRCSIPVRAALQPIGRHRAEVEAAVYFCCVEALQNAVKHAQAATIGVSCWRDDDHLHLVVVDDGVGFDQGVAPGGNGIANLRDRLGSIGGTLEITPVPAGGTAVRGTVPVRPVGSVVVAP
jgi:signal transduction histidine kinase